MYHLMQIYVNGFAEEGLIVAFSATANGRP